MEEEEDEDFAENVFAGAAGDRIRNCSDSSSDDDDDDYICYVCNRGDRPDVMVICETCTGGDFSCVHIDCADPPLEEVPKGAWYCKSCALQQEESRKLTEEEKAVQNIRLKSKQRRARSTLPDNVLALDPAKALKKTSAVEGNNIPEEVENGVEDGDYEEGNSGNAAKATTKKKRITKQQKVDHNKKIEEKGANFAKQNKVPQKPTSAHIVTIDSLFEI